MRVRRGVSDSMVAGLLITGALPLILVLCGVVFGFPWVVTVLGAVAAVIVGLLVTGMTEAGERRDTYRWQETAVTVADWAGRNGGRSETTPEALVGDEWTLPESPRFAGEILAVARRDDLEVGVVCHVEHETEGGAARHTAVLVRLPKTHPAIRATPHRLTGALAEAVATVPGRVALVEIADQELRIVFPGWPPAFDLGVQVDAVVKVAHGL